MKVTSSFGSLSDLPDDLLMQILEFLPAQRDIYTMCLVSRRINAVADTCLYRSISFDQSQILPGILTSLTTRPRRGSLIQNVRLEYPGSELSNIVYLKDSPNQINDFSYAVSTMSNLENLVISVPESLCRGIGTLFSNPFDLACLKSCSLFYQREDGGYWDLQDNIHIFSHPTLENLTIRRAKLGRQGFESIEQPSETPLMELNLIECDINDDGLSDLLLIPNALKEITITQLQFPSPPLEESPDDVEDYVLAMQSAQHSLQTIAIDFASLSAENPLKLRAFDSLRNLELRDYQLFGQSSGSPRLHSVGLPPNLELLKFLNPVGEDEDLADLLCYTIENRDLLARKLYQIVAVKGERGFPPKLVEACTSMCILLHTI